MRTLVFLATRANPLRVACLVLWLALASGIHCDAQAWTATLGTPSVSQPLTLGSTTAFTLTIAPGTQTVKVVGIPNSLVATPACADSAAAVSTWTCTFQAVKVTSGDQIQLSTTPAGGASTPLSIPYSVKAAQYTVAIASTAGSALGTLDDKGNTFAMSTPAASYGFTMTPAMSGIALVSSNPNILEVSANTLIPKNAGSCDLSVSVGGLVLAKFPADVVNPILSIKPSKARISVYEQSPVSLPTINLAMAVGPDQTAQKGDLTIVPDNAGLVTFTGVGLKASSLPPLNAGELRKETAVTLTPLLKAKFSNATPAIAPSAVIDVLVYHSLGTVSFDQPSVTLLPGQTLAVSAFQSYPDGTKQTGLTYNWDLAEIDTDKKKAQQEHLKFTRSTNGPVVFVGAFSSADLESLNLQGPIALTVTLSAAKADPDAPDVPSSTFFVQLARVEGFKAMHVKLNVMDDRTAEDLFGKLTTKEYYVATVRMVNDLSKDKKGAPLGQSIMAFGASVEVGITLQKRAENAKKNDDWEALVPADWAIVKGVYNYTDEDCVERVPTKSGNPNLPPIGPTEYLTDSHRVCPPPFLTYRPYSYDVMLNTVDPRDSRSARSQFFRYANLVGLGASFGSAIFQVGIGTSVPTILDKYSNMLVPGLDKLFASMKETQRQNFVSMTMRAIEEIPYGSDLERKLFIPKREFSGVIPGYKVRIAQINPYHFTINVAILDKTNGGTVSAADPSKTK